VDFERLFYVRNGPGFKRGLGIRRKAAITLILRGLSRIVDPVCWAQINGPSCLEGNTLLYQ
jgi:hypothetical protein